MDACIAMDRNVAQLNARDLTRPHDVSFESLSSKDRNDLAFNPAKRYLFSDKMAVLLGIEKNERFYEVLLANSVSVAQVTRRRDVIQTWNLTWSLIAPAQGNPRAQMQGPVANTPMKEQMQRVLRNVSLRRIKAEIPELSRQLPPIQSSTVTLTIGPYEAQKHSFAARQMYEEVENFNQAVDNRQAERSRDALAKVMKSLTQMRLSLYAQDDTEVLVCEGDKASGKELKFLTGEDLLNVVKKGD